MRILITGGAGFIGSHTSDALRELKHEVFVLDNFVTGKLSNISERTGIPPFYFHADITEALAVMKVMEDAKPDAVLHLATQSAITTSMNNPAHDLNVNARGTLNVINACNKHGVKRLVFSSTSAVYKENGKSKLKEGSPLEPNTPYGVSKLAAEMYVRFMFSNHVVLRYANIYGERQVPIGENQLIPRIIRRFLYGDNFKIFGSGNQSRDFVYVGDVVRANIAALISADKGTYNVSSAHSFSVNEICGIMEDIYDVHGYKWEHTGAEDVRKYVCMDNTHAWSGMRWSPSVRLRDGIENTAKWWENKDENDLSLTKIEMPSPTDKEIIRK